MGWADEPSWWIQDRAESIDWGDDMALMTEDVINKDFTATELGRGYDENEVDDFLDQIVVELRRLTADNDELRSLIPPEAMDKIEAAKFSAEQAEKDAAARIAKADEDAQLAETEAADRAHAAAEAAQTAEAEAADKIAREALDVNVSDAADDGPDTSEMAAAAAAGLGSASGMLALAQSLHDGYVSEGLDTRKRLIGEGQSRHDQVVTEATALHEELVSTGQAQHDHLVSVGQATHDELLTVGRARHDALVSEAEALLAKATAEHEHLITEARERSTQMVAEAQQKRAEVFQTLAHERGLLQNKIDELRTFERDQRARMKTYHQSQLIELGEADAHDTDSDRTDTDRTDIDKIG
jgi:DivIVA domain-containing protein